MTFVQVMALLGVFIIGIVVGAVLSVKFFSYVFKRLNVVSLRLASETPNDYCLHVDVQNPFGTEAGVSTFNFRVGEKLKADLLVMFDRVKE